jgi:hypothetical protein
VTSKRSVPTGSGSEVHETINIARVRIKATKMRFLFIDTPPKK